MYGILADDADVARGNRDGLVYYRAERASGQRRDPVDGAVNCVACWGDTATVEANPERAAVTRDGVRATPDAEGHHWGTVCPTDPDYRSALLDRVEAVGSAGDVRLTTLGFPGDSFCHCERCDRLFADSDRDDRDAWRTDVVTGFVADAADRVDGDLIASLYPDPYPGNLRERAGVDPRALAPHVDGFYVPLCSVSYETTYWVESLARGFARELDGLDVPLTLHLSAAEADADRLADVARQVERHATNVVFATHRCDVDVARDAIRRLRDADARREAV